MRILRVIIAVAMMTAALGAVVASPDVASAADTSGGAQDGVIWAGVQIGTPSGTSGTSGCTWTLLVVYDSHIGRTTSISRVVDGVRYDLYERRCGSAFTDIWIPQLSSSQIARSAAVLAQGRLPVPSPSFAPSTNAMVVDVPIWFWIDAAWWTPVTATAWIPTIFGPVWSRATATPMRITFLTQDDASRGGPGLGVADCVGPGWPWNPSVPDEATSPCSYTYRHSSLARDSGVFVAVVGVEWRISWTSSTGEGGSLPSYTTSTFVIDRVGELQALVD